MDKRCINYNSTTLRRSCFHFEDKVDRESINYGRIIVIKADTINDAWAKLLKSHQEQYNEISCIQEIMHLYKYLYETVI